MREYKAIFICILICNVFVCPKSFGQTDYTYEKGKSFKNTNALSMTDTIDLTSISSPIPYKKSIPGLLPVRYGYPGTSEVFSSAETPVREILNGPTIPTGSYLGCSTI